MGDDQDWRLRADLADPAGVHARLRDARHFEQELEPLIGDDVVLSYDEDTLFAYANTRETIDQTRRAIEHQLASDGLAAKLRIDHWDDGLGDVGDWHEIDPPPDGTRRAQEAAERHEHAEHEADEARIETRTVAITSGRMVRTWFETTVADEARELGVELSIVERPHLLTTQIAFTLRGPTGSVDTVVEDLAQRAGAVTRLETYYPIVS
jgi:hypothetical protein